MKTMKLRTEVMVDASGKPYTVDVWREFRQVHLMNRVAQQPVDIRTVNGEELIQVDGQWWEFGYPPVRIRPEQKAS